MSENLNTELTVEAWAEITIKEWVSKAAMLGISPDDPLSLDRFVQHVITNSNGDPQRVEFAYDYYLNFIDWGVGNGVTLEDRDLMISSGATTRRPKLWFTDVFYKQVKILAHLMAEKNAKAAALMISTNLTKYDSSGSKVNPTKSAGSSGSRGSVDSVTGKKKITYKEFEERRKKNGW